MNHLVNHPETPVVNVYLVIQKKDNLDIENIKRVIEKNHNKPNIFMVKAPEIFQSLTGLLNLVEKHQDNGIVYVKAKEFNQDAIRTATRRDLPFVMLLKNNDTGEWTSFCVNQIKRPRRVRVRRRFYYRALSLV